MDPLLALAFGLVFQKTLDILCRESFEEFLLFL
jgi:hypothetical protein